MMCSPTCTEHSATPHVTHQIEGLPYSLVDRPLREHTSHGSSRSVGCVVFTSSRPATPFSGRRMHERQIGHLNSSPPSVAASWSIHRAQKLCRHAKTRRSWPVSKQTAHPEKGCVSASSAEGEFTRGKDMARARHVCVCVGIPFCYLPVCVATRNDPDYTVGRGQLQLRYMFSFFLDIPMAKTKQHPRFFDHRLQKKAVASGPG